MFRVVENPDGTTSIICKNSGNLLCTVPSKANSNAHQRINVVEPQPSNSKWRHSSRQQLYSVPKGPTEDPYEEKDGRPLTRKSLCRLSAIPISVDGDQSEDYSGDCVSEDSFAKCLNLVPRSIWESTPREKLLAEWPLRLLSRSKAYRTLEPPPKDVKIADQLPLTSPLGVRILKMNKARAFAGADRIKAQMRAYESFCRHPWNASSSNACHFPKLRCREKKTYPVVATVRVLRHTPHTHTYTRGRRQRRERERIRSTGLEARSRKLFRQCNRSSLRVNVTRLSETEIRDWLSRRDPPPQDSESEEEEEYDPSYRPSRRTTAVHRSRSDTRTAASTAGCYVKVRNVVMDIHRRGDTHYVKNTNIRVPFYRDFFASLTSNRPLVNAVYNVKLLPRSVAEEVHFGETRNVSLKRSPASRVTHKSKPSKRDVDSKDVDIFGKIQRTVRGTTCTKEAPSKGWQQKTTTPLVRRSGDSSSKQRPAKKFKPVEVDLTADSDKADEPVASAPGSFEFPPRGKACLKKIPPSQTPSVVQNSPTKLRWSSFGASGSGQETKGPLVFIHSPSSGWKELQPTKAALQKRSPPETLGNPSTSFVSGAISYVQETEKPVVLKHSPGLSSSKAGHRLKARKMFTKKSNPVVLNLDTDSSAFRKLVQFQPRDTPGTSAEKISSDSDDSITLIDLTEETTPPRKTPPPLQRTPSLQNRPEETTSGGRSSNNAQLRRFFSKTTIRKNQQEIFEVYRWKFSCFACGFQKLFLNRDQEEVVEKAVEDHLLNYHHVSEAEPFLSRYLDRVDHCTVIEAFPGFKGSDEVEVRCFI